MDDLHLNENVARTTYKDIYISSSQNQHTYLIAAKTNNQMDRCTFHSHSIGRNFIKAMELASNLRRGQYNTNTDNYQLIEIIPISMYECRIAL